MSESKNMGIGPIGNPHTTFVRKFRWTLECYDFFNDDKITLHEHWFKNVAIDFARSRIDFQAYEVIFDKDAEDIEIQEWLDKENHESEVLAFTSYTGCGEPIYRYQFFNPVVIRDEMSFDYGSSEESVRNVSIKFDDYTRTYLYKGKNKHTGPLKKKYQWKLRLEGKPEINIQMDQRPNLSIEEIAINHLNAKMYVPGKARWHTLSIVLPQDHEESGILEQLMKFEPTDLYLDLYTMDGKTKLETWKLLGAWMQQANTGEHARPKITIRFSGAEYVQAVTTT